MSHFCRMFSKKTKYHELSLIDWTNGLFMHKWNKAYVLSETEDADKLARKVE